jgi:hypothetical protein
MRHENIETTLRHYVGRNATAGAVWEAYENIKRGTVLDTAAQNNPSAEVEISNLNNCHA